MRLVEQVINSFFVDLQVGAVHGELLATRARLLLDHFKQKADRSGHDTLILTSLDNGDRLAFVVRTVLVPFHRECFSRASLPVGEDCGVITLAKANHVKSEP